MDGPPSDLTDAPAFGEDQAQSFLRQNYPGVAITSGFRTPAHNAEVGGVSDSMHTTGQAVDFVLPHGASPDGVRARLASSGYPVTEFLNEGNHIHWGWRPKSGVAAPQPSSPAPLTPPGDLLSPPNDLVSGPAHAVPSSSGKPSLEAASDAFIASLGRVANAGKGEVEGAWDQLKTDMGPALQATDLFMPGLGRGIRGVNDVASIPFGAAHGPVKQSMIEQGWNPVAAELVTDALMFKGAPEGEGIHIAPDWLRESTFGKPPSGGSGPPGSPPPDLVSPTPHPSEMPAVGEPIGLKHPQTGEIQHAVVTGYHDNGSLASVSYGDGTHGWLDTHELLRDRVEAPQGQTTPPAAAVGRTEADLSAVPFSDEETFARPAKPQPITGALDPEAIAAIDQADRLEHSATHPASTLPAETRTAMLTEAARLRQRYGFDPENPAPEPARPAFTPRAGEGGKQGSLFQPGTPFKARPDYLGERLHAPADLSDVARAAAARLTGYDPVQRGIWTRDFVVAHGAKNGTEILVLHDAHGNPITAYTDGRPHGVDFTDDTLAALNDPKNPVVSHHNHPSGNSFSNADIRSLHYPAHAAMLVHGANGEFYAVMPTAELRASNPTDLRMDALYRRTTEDMHPVGTDAIKSGAMTVDEANYLVHHAVNAALDRAGVTDYLSNREVPPHLQPIFDQWVREGAQEAARLADVLNLGRNYDRLGQPYRSPRSIQPEEGIRGVLARVGQQAPEQGGTIGAPGSEGLSPNAGAYRKPQQLKLLQPQREYVEQPETPGEGKEYFDNVAHALAADHGGGKGTGNYARFAARNLGPGGKWNPGATKSLGDIWRNAILPRTLASMDWRSGRYYAATAAQSEDALTRMANYRDHAQPFNSLPEESKDRVLAVAELNRLDSISPQEGRTVIAKNVDHPLAELSKPGETIRLNDDEARALFGLKGMFAHQWRDMIEGTAKKLGWDGPPDPAAIRDAAAHESTQGGTKRFNQIADILEAFQQQERAGYIPLMRFGDHYIAIKRKMQPGEDSLGGFPKVDWYGRVESKGPWENLFGRSGTETGTPKAVMQRINDLNAKGNFGEFRLVDGEWQSPTHMLETGPVPRNIDQLRSLDIPAVEKLMTALEHRSGSGDKSFQSNPAYKAMMDEIRDQLYEELKAGFKKRSNTVPGYDPDFRRAMGSYSFWLSHHVADMVHGDSVESARDEIENHPDENVRKFWRQWDHDMETRPDLLAKGANALQNFAFYWEMGANPASTFSILTHGGTVAIPTLSAGTSFPRAAGAFFKAQSETLAALRANGEKGLHFGDVSRIGKTPDEKTFLNDLERSGLLHSRLADEFGRIHTNAFEGAFRNQAQRLFDIWGSNISAADRLSRIPSALAAYRLAKEPGGFERFAKTWGNDENFKAAVSRYGKTPEAVGRFMTNEAAFEYGKRNQPAWQRNALGGLLGQFHGFQIRAFSRMLQLSSRLGPEGKRAAAAMMLAVGGLAGLNGLPFVKDAENGYDAIKKLATGKDPNIEAEQRKWLEEKSGLGKLGADMVLRGPVSTAMGVDLTDRLGFGDPVSRTLGSQEFFGAAPAIVAGAITRGMARARTRQGATAAAAEFAPNAIKAPLQAYGAWPREGVRSSQGRRPIVPAARITPADQMRRAVGFEPLTVTKAYEKRSDAYRAKHGS